VYPAGPLPIIRQFKRSISVLIVSLFLATNVKICGDASV